MIKMKIICKNCNAINDARLKNIRKNKELIAKYEKLLEETKKKDKLCGEVLDNLYKRYKEIKNSKKFKILNMLTLGFYGLNYSRFGFYLSNLDKQCKSKYLYMAYNLGMLERDFLSPTLIYLRGDTPRGVSMLQHSIRKILENSNRKVKYFKCRVCGHNNFIELE